MRPFLLAGTLIASVTSVVAIAYPEGAPAQHSGGFGEADCSQCHYAGDDLGELRLDGPGSLQAGERHRLILELTGSSVKVAGLQLTVRDEDGKQVGQFVEQEGLQSQEVEQVIYLTHAKPFAASDGLVRWEIEWQAPKNLPEDVQVNASVVAANDDQSPLGDTVLKLDQAL